VLALHQQLNAEIAARVAEAFDLGTVGSISYLATGLMNRNWRLTTDRGTYALKQIIDVPVPTAQRNLRVLTALHQAGIPTCPPVLSRSGEAVILIDGLGYCTLPWRDGTHPQGPDLTLTQARHLGVVVGRIHDALGRVGPDLGLPPATARPTVQVTAPDDAIAEAHRYQAAAKAVDGPFDHAVVELLDRRIALIDKHAADRPATEQITGPYGWTHGDLQYRNIIWRDGQINAVIDWDRIRVRPFAEEIARTATIQFGTPDGLDLERIAAFVTGYRTIMLIDDAALADGLHRLWWKRMSDFWHLVYHYDRENYTCDDLFISGELLLHWWTTHANDVRDAFTRHARP
jgi:homoserine kinase type II